MKSFGQRLTELIGHQRTKPISSPPATRPALTLPEDVMCYLCDRVVPIRETISVYMPDDQSDYHRVCGNCYKPTMKRNI